MELELMYSEYKPLLFSIAYRLLGTVADAEDMVQETFAAVVPAAVPSVQLDADPSTFPSQSLDKRQVDNWKAYLCRAVTNRCMDLLKSARRKRELYVGPWLPEPLIQGTAQLGADPLEATMLEETVSYAFLVMLERLTPLERVVFVLREAFEYSYRDIAETVGKTELGCRQTYSRVRRKVQTEPATNIQVDLGETRALVERFLNAATTGNVGALIELLSEDAELLSDGGGKILAATKPIIGRDRIIMFLSGLAAKQGPTTTIRLALVNGSAGLVIDVPDGTSVMMLEPSEDGRCSRIYIIRNPDKLTTLSNLLAP